MSLLFDLMRGRVAGGASATGLDLIFTNPAQTLDPRITFTRASAGTRFNSAGVLKTVPVNLLTYSEQFDNAAWTKLNATVTANAVIAPDGTLTADKLIGASGATNYSVARQVISLTVGSTYTYSVYAKAGENRYMQIVGDGNSQTDYANFDLVAGVLGSYSGTVPIIQSVGNGWYRCILTSTYASLGFVGQIGIIDAANDPRADRSGSGDGTSGIYIWGAQLETGSVANDYSPTTSTSTGGPRFDYDPVTLAPKGLLIEEQRTNLLTYSEQFDNSAWNKSNTTVTANAVVSPDGTITADKLVEDTANALHYAGSSPVTPSAGAVYTATGYAKAGERNWLVIVSVVGGNVTYRSFNLASGTLGTTTDGSSTASIAAAGNGWYRCSLTFTATAATAGTVRYWVESTDSIGAYTGDGTSGIYIWGAQLEAGAFPTSYIPTVASQVTRAADVATMTGTNFSSFYNQTEGTLFVSGSAPAKGAVSTWTFAAIDDTTLNNRIELDLISGSLGGVGRINIVSGGVSQFDTGNVNTPTFVAGTVYSVAAAYKTNNFGYSLGGAAATTSASGTVPTGLTVFSIGSRSASPTYLNGHIRRIAYYPRRLSNTELVALTS